MVERGKSRDDYLLELNRLEGLELVKAVSKSVFKKFRGYGLKSLGIDSYDEVVNVVYILYREKGIDDDCSFLSLYRNFIDYYRKERMNATSLNEELEAVLTDDYSASIELRRDLFDYIRSLGLDYSLFEEVILNGKDPKAMFEERGLSVYKGYKEIRRMKYKVIGFLTEY